MNAGTRFADEDARRAFEVLRAGGIAILPMDVGYSLIADVVQRHFAVELPPAT